MSDDFAYSFSLEMGCINETLENICEQLCEINASLKYIKRNANFMPSSYIQDIRLQAEQSQPLLPVRPHCRRWT